MVPAVVITIFLDELLAAWTGKVPPGPERCARNGPRNHPRPWPVRGKLLSMRVTVLYFEGCPNWQLARGRVTEALASVESSAEIEAARVETLEEAEALGFSGSPTILIDGEDPFPHAAGVAMACRLYGSEHAPSVTGLIAALRERS